MGLFTVPATMATHNSHYGTLGTLVKSGAISLPCLPFPTTGQQLKELFPITRNTYWEGDRSLALLYNTNPGSSMSQSPYQNKRGFIKL